MLFGFDCVRFRNQLGHCFPIIEYLACCLCGFHNILFVHRIICIVFGGKYTQISKYDNEEYEQDKQDYISKRIHIYKAIIAAPIIEELQFRLLLLQILDP